MDLNVLAVALLAIAGLGFFLWRTRRPGPSRPTALGVLGQLLAVVVVMVMLATATDENGFVFYGTPLGCAGVAALSVWRYRRAGSKIETPQFGAAKLDPDPWPAIQDDMARNHPDQFVIGETGDGPDFSKPRTNVLILGPPQTGKTSGVLIPQILTAPGAVVAVTSKGGDLFRATAQTRARFGRLWHYSPTNADELLPGTTPLRWSPIDGCKDWNTAVRSATAMTEVAEAGRSENANFFRAQTAQLLTPVFYAAGHADKPIDWVMDIVAGSSDALRECQRILSGLGTPEAGRAQSMFSAVINAETRTRSNILATAQTAFRGYWMASATASTIDPNFDPVEFCTSGTDTIYIEAPAEDQEIVAPLVVGLLSAISKAQFELHGRANTVGQPLPPAQLWVLDELASMAPMQRLPALVTTSASQGLFLTCVLQDLSFARRKWAVEGEAFLTIFGTRVIFPGIANEETLRAIANLGGRSWIDYETNNESYGSEDSSYTVNRHRQLVDNLTAGHIHKAMLGDNDALTGNEQVDSRRMLVLRGDTISRAWCAPYYAASPYRELLVANAEECEDPSLPLPALSTEYMNPRLAERWDWVTQDHWERS